MTRARETSRLQVATNLDGISGLDEFAVIDTSVKLIDS